MKKGSTNIRCSITLLDYGEFSPLNVNCYSLAALSMQVCTKFEAGRVMQDDDSARAVVTSILNVDRGYQSILQSKFSSNVSFLDMSGRTVSIYWKRAFFFQAFASV